MGEGYGSRKGETVAGAVVPGGNSASVLAIFAPLSSFYGHLPCRAAARFAELTWRDMWVVAELRRDYLNIGRAIPKAWRKTVSCYETYSGRCGASN